MNHSDLVQPRLAWVFCEGLPLSAWNKQNWERILGDWGTILSGTKRVLSYNMYQMAKLCIETHKVLDIDKTINVHIENKGFWVRTKESNFCFDGRKYSKGGNRKTMTNRS